MSDPVATDLADAAAVDVAAALPSDLAPPGLWGVFSRGWRPFCGWMCGLILLRAAVVPIWELAHGLPVEPVEWVPITAFAGLLIVTRSYDKSKGTA